MQGGEGEANSKQDCKYKKFLDDIYTCIKDKDHLPRKSTTPELQLFNKSQKKDSILGLSTIEELADPRPIKTASTGKGNKFKKFLSALDEQQKKVSLNNMNLLGLQVKKISYCEKEKRRAKNMIDVYEENTTTNQKSLSQSQVRRTINCETTQDFLCRKIRVSHRQILTKPLMARRHSFRTKSSKSDYKRKTICDLQNPIYENRINSYKQLIFKVQTAHGFFIDTQKDLKPDFNLRNEKKYKAWVGLGNNGNLIKGLLKRRFWWSVMEEKSLNVNFIWTQLRNMDFMGKQAPSDLWVPDKSKVWGKDPVFHSQNIGSQKKKKRSMFQEVKENFNYKIMVSQGRVKMSQLNGGSKQKSYKEKQELMELPIMDNSECRVHNHLSNNFYLGNKKALFYNLKQYCELVGQNVFDIVPLTFHIKKGFKDPQYKRFVAYYKRRQLLMKKAEKEEGEKKEKKKMRNVWIVKPGELTNRGNGITVIDEVYELNHIMKREAQHENGLEKTFIVQLYIDQPMLYQKRKFDIRHFMLVTHINGLMRAYWYREGYLRTSSYEFDILNFEREIHLTNDAVQKFTPLYGKFEPANKLSYAQFQRYLDVSYPKRKYNFEAQILPEMKSIGLDAVKSSYLKLSPHRLKHNFEIFGLDFMIDQNFKPWLIEINTNPCLEICCPLLSRIIPQMLDQALRLSLDIVFPPPCHYPNTCKHLAPEANLENLNYELIFDEKKDGSELRTLYKASTQNLLEQIGQISEDQIYQDNGKDVTLDQVL